MYAHFESHLQVVYISGRPSMQQLDVLHWLNANGFPPGKQLAYKNGVMIHHSFRAAWFEFLSAHPRMPVLHSLYSSTIHFGCKIKERV